MTNLSPVRLPLEGLRPGGGVHHDEVLTPNSIEKIDDRRSSPSKEDHDAIVDSLQQGLANVESVIVYDTEHPIESDDDEHDERTVIWRRRAPLRMLCDLCVLICDCHSCIRR